MKKMLVIIVILAIIGCGEEEEEIPGISGTYSMRLAGSISIHGSTYTGSETVIASIVQNGNSIVVYITDVEVQGKGTIYGELVTFHIEGPLILSFKFGSVATVYLMALIDQEGGWKSSFEGTLAEDGTISGSFTSRDLASGNYPANGTFKLSPTTLDD